MYIATYKPTLIINLIQLCSVFLDTIYNMWFETLLMYLVTLIAIIFTTLYVYFKYKYTTWDKANIPHLKPSFPFGNLKTLATLQESLGDCFMGIYNELKEKTLSVGGFYNFAKPSIMVIDPELVKTILTKDFGSFHDRGMFYDEENDPLMAHLLLLKGQKWRTSRAKITPIFTSGKMKHMFHTMLETSRELGNIFDAFKGKPIDINDIFARQATDVIGSVAFGLECNSLIDPNTEFRHYGKKIFEFGIKESIINALSTNCPIILKTFKIPQIPNDISEFFMNVLRQTIDYREKNNIKRKDFLDLLIRLKNKESVLDEILDTNTKETEEGLTFNELAAHAFVFFAAGFETTSSTLNFCLYELSTNPQIQVKVRQEIQNVMKKYEDKLSYEGIMEMKYMDKVFQEVLRKYPPVPVLQREASEDYKVPDSDMIIPKGTEIIISTLGLQYDPNYYPNPEIFDPERFTEEEKAKRHNYTHLPFGEGPRICIGMRFALLQVKIVLSVLLMDFKFKLDPKTVIPVVFDPKRIFLSPKHTIWLQADRI